MDRSRSVRAGVSDRRQGKDADAKTTTGASEVSELIPLAAMAMTLRLTDDEARALRQRAKREGRSMQDVARGAVREYIERTSRRELLDEVLDEELPRYVEALHRLGE